MFICQIVESDKLYFCVEAKEIFSESFCSLDFFVSFFYQEKNEKIIFSK